MHEELSVLAKDSRSHRDREGADHWSLVVKNPSREDGGRD
jgi:hypothetical protein